MHLPRMVIFTLMLAIVSASGTLQAQEKSETKKQERPIDILAWLNGEVWTADTSTLRSGMKRIETRYTWSDNETFLRFITHFVMDKGVLKNCDGQFFWDREQNSLEIWYMDASNNITKGPVKIDGNVMEVSFRGQDFEGKIANLRVTVTRRSADHYTWNLEQEANPGWKQLLQLEYLRTN